MRLGSVLIVAVVVVVGLAAAGVVGLSGGSVESQSSGHHQEVPVDFPPNTGEFGIVRDFGKTSSGLSIFGWQVMSADYRAYVAVIPPAGCQWQGQSELSAEGACAGIPASGDISGGGTTIDGVRYAIVSVAISEECRSNLSVGDHWPSDAPGCAE